MNAYELQAQSRPAIRRLDSRERTLTACSQLHQGAPLIVDTSDVVALERALREALQTVSQSQEIAAIIVLPLAGTSLVELGYGPAGEESARRPLQDSVRRLAIDRAAHEVRADGHSVQLTAKEFALLSYLHERRGAVLTRQVLLADIWGARYAGGPRTVDVHVRRLRRKLGAALALDTVRGVGYKFRRDDQPLD
jgi:DNA-binding response OmpR family regulator